MSNSASENYERFLSFLDYRNSGGLKELEQNSDDLVLAQKKLGIDAVYSGNVDGRKTSLVYFKKIENPEENTLRNLYRNVWNEGRASLLIVILPWEIKVYNPNAKPVLSQSENVDAQDRLIESIQLRNVALENATNIDIYQRKYIDSRDFWDIKSENFSEDYRVDKHLHKDLKALKRRLEVDEELDVSYVNSLIIKSIFVLFLEHRNLLDESFYNRRDFAGPFESILPEKTETYRLFDEVGEEFNGDIFIHNKDERKHVQENHLEWVKRFIKGEDVSTGQQRLFPYSFDIVPVELISSIYEDFVPNEQGVYYTPYYLVEHILQDLSELVDEDSKILDPACGSGVFLVSAFEKILDSVIENKGRLEKEDIIQVAQKKLVGVDKNPEAVKITAFSLSLKILEYLDYQTEADTIHLPNLVGINIFERDFFGENEEIDQQEFDVIIGNPPWIRDRDSKGMKYCKEKGFATGNNQIALCFMWKSLELLSDEGEACFIVPTRALLMNRRTREFREDFFTSASIKSILNLSILRKSLFENSDSPASIIRFSSGSDRSSKIQYITPKHQPINILQSLEVNPNDIKYLPSSEFDERLWKAAMYGDTRDLQLIRRLEDEPTIFDFVDEFGLETGEGFQLGGPKNTEDLEIEKIPHLEARKHRPYYVDTAELKEFQGTTFHRPRTSSNIWSGPRVLIKEGINTTSSPNFRSLFTESDMTFRHGIMAIRGDDDVIDLLKALNLYLNSKFAQYFIFMTSPMWGVERALIQKDDIMQFPFPFNQITDVARELSDLHDRLVDVLKEDKSGEADRFYQKIDQAIYDLLNFSEQERLLVESRVANTLDYFHKGKQSQAVKPPSRENLETYVRVTTKYLTEFLDDDNIAISGKFFEDSKEIVRFGQVEAERTMKSPLNLVLLYLDSNRDVEIEEATDELTEKIEEIDSHIIHHNEESIFFKRRNVFYHLDEMFIIKPNELRFWDAASAVNDIPWLIGDLIEKGGGLR